MDRAIFNFITLIYSVLPVKVLYYPPQERYSQNHIYIYVLRKKSISIDLFDEALLCVKPFIHNMLFQSNENGLMECPLCLAELPIEFFPIIQSCHHRSCYDCFQQYLKVEISESRVNIACPECSEPMHPNGE